MHTRSGQRIPTPKRTCPTPDNPDGKGGPQGAVFLIVPGPLPAYLLWYFPAYEVQLTVLGMLPHLHAVLFLSLPLYLSPSLCLSLCIRFVVFIYFRLGERWAEWQGFATNDTLEQLQCTCEGHPESNTADMASPSVALPDCGYLRGLTYTAQNLNPGRTTDRHPTFQRRSLTKQKILPAAVVNR